MATTPLNVERKEDYGLGTAGKLYSSELMTIVDNMDSIITKFDGWQDIPVKDRLKFALTTLRHDSTFIVSGTGNNVILTSKHLGKLSYENGEIITFVNTANNTGNSRVTIDSLTHVPLLTSTGDQIPAGTLKVGCATVAKFDSVRHAFTILESTDLNTLKNNIADDFEAAGLTMLNNNASTGNLISKLSNSLRDLTQRVSSVYGKTISDDLSLRSHIEKYRTAITKETDDKIVDVNYGVSNVAATLGTLILNIKSDLLDAKNRLESVYAKTVSDDLKTKHLVSTTADTLRAEREALAELHAIVDWQTFEAIAEYVRKEKNSGIMDTYSRNISLDEEDNYKSVHGNFLKIHNHSNYKGMPGMGRLAFNANGYVGRTRHNDYKLDSPKANGHAFETETSEPTAVPASVLNASNVANGITAVKNLFSKYHAGTLTEADEINSFQWELSYLESWWEIITDPKEAVSDTFDSFRHTYGTKTPIELALKYQENQISGKKNRFENILNTPIVKRIDDNGVERLTVQRYRIVTKRLAGLNGKRWEEVMKARSNVLAEAYYDTDIAENSTVNRYNIKNIDGLLNQIPSLGGYSENIRRKTGDNYVITAPSNMARYHRRFSVAVDAMGVSNFINGWTDPTLITGYTDNDSVFGGVSYLLPLEMILRTPLERWNPYNVSLSSTFTGNGSETNPYSASYENSRYFLTPTELFNSGTAYDPAATRYGAWVNDDGGTARNLRSSGIYIMLPNIESVGTRIRFPVNFLSDDYSMSNMRIEAGKKALARQVANSVSILGNLSINIKNDMLDVQSRLDDMYTEGNGKISKLASDISKEIDRIDDNIVDVNQLVSDNTNDISTNADNISTNADDIEELQNA